MRTGSRILKVGLYVGSLLLFLNLANSKLDLKAVPRGGGAQVNGPAAAEYTAVLEEFIVFRDGHEKLASVQTWASRADGARVMRLGREGEASRMIFLPSGVRITVYDKTKGKSTEQRSPGSPQPNLDAQCKNLNDVFVGAETVGAFDALKYTVTSSDRHMTIWYAPKFNCQTVRRVLEFNDGSRSELRLVSLTPGLAAPLFDVPPDYNEGPPSSIAPELAACAEGTPCAEQRAKLDAAYFKNRVPGQ